MSGQEDKGVPQGEGEGGLRVSGGDGGEDPARLGDCSPVMLCCLEEDMKKVSC